MQDQQILDQIKELVDAEHELRQQAARGEVDVADEQERMRSLEVALDRCWDLLRRRRALRDDAHADPAGAEDRGSATVEGYLQ